MYTLTLQSELEPRAGRPVRQHACSPALLVLHLCKHTGTAFIASPQHGGSSPERRQSSPRPRPAAVPSVGPLQVRLSSVGSAVAEGAAQLTVLLRLLSSAHSVSSYCIPASFSPCRAMSSVGTRGAGEESMRGWVTAG